MCSIHADILLGMVHMQNLAKSITDFWPQGHLGHMLCMGHLRVGTSDRVNFTRNLQGIWLFTEVLAPLLESHGPKTYFYTA